MQKLKSILQPKLLRLLALSLVLFASLLLLVQDYGSHYMVTLGPISWDRESNSAEVHFYAANPSEPRRRIQVQGSWLMLRQIERVQDGDFLAVIKQRGENLFFERIYILSTPEVPGLQGPRLETGMRLDLAVGRKPVLVEMIGLDKFGYQLSLPTWAKKIMPDADKVYYQPGSFDTVKSVLEQDDSYVPDIYILDSQGRVAGVRSIAGSLITFPAFLRGTALVLYILALISGVASMLIYKQDHLLSLGRRIWDQVSIRGRNAAN